MSLRPIADLIAKQLSGIFSGIDTDNIQSSIWDGTLELTDLMLNKSRLNPKLGSVRILSSHVDKVLVSIPWKRVYEDSAILEMDGLNLQLLCDRAVPLDTLWLERVRLIEAVQESLKLQESLGIFAALLKTMFRKARISLRNVLINISIGDMDMLTIRFDSLSVEPDSSMEDIASDALNKITRIENLAIALNGKEILESVGSREHGVSLTCNARIFQGSLSLNLELPEKTKISVRETNFFEIVSLLFEQQKTLAPFKPPQSASALESLRIEYLYMLENPSPNWTDRKRFIELSVSPMTVASWRRQVLRNSGINVRDLFTSISNIGSPDRTPPTTTEESQLLSGPLKVDFRLLDCVVALELPNRPVFSLHLSKSIVSLVFPVGRRIEEFTARFIFSNVTANVHGDKLISFDMNMTVLKSIADGFEYDVSLKHSPDGFQLSPRVIRNLTDIIEAFPKKATSDLSVDEVMKNVEFLAKDVKDSKIQLSVDPLDFHFHIDETCKPIIFRIGAWSCMYSYTGGLHAKSEPVNVFDGGAIIGTIPAIQIITDEDGVTSFFFAGSIEIERFPKSLVPQQIEIKRDILDSDELRLSHGLFYRIMRLFNLRNLVFNAPMVKIEDNSLDHVQVDINLSDEGFDILGTMHYCEINDEILTTFKIDPILSKPSKVVTIRASHMGSANQTPIYIETGPLSLSITLPTEMKPALEVSSIVNLIDALKPMVELDIPKVSVTLTADFDLCKLRADTVRFSRGRLEIGKLDCELPNLESIMRIAQNDSNRTTFDPSSILPPIQVRELYAMGRFEGLNEDVVVGCTNLVHSGDTNYSASHVFVSTEAGCILEFRNMKANRFRAETVDGIVINLSRQLVTLLEGIIESSPKPKSVESAIVVPYKLILSSVHFNFRDEHIISHIDLGMDVAVNLEFDESKHIVNIAESSRIWVRKTELKELCTNTLVLRNDTRGMDALHIDFSGKVVIPLDESASVLVNFSHIDLRNGFKLILEDINEVKRLFELIPTAQSGPRPKRPVDLNCAVGIIDPINVIAYSSGRPIMSTEVQAGLISVYHSVVPNVRSITKVLIPEAKLRAIVRNLKHGSWESLVQDSAFSLEVSEIRDPNSQDGGSLKINLTGLGEVDVGLTPHTISCVRTLAESSRDTVLEATGSDTFHVVNLINRVIEFRKDSNTLLVVPKNSAVVADSVMMKDDDGIELINFRVLETSSQPSASSSFSREESAKDASDWTIIDVTGNSDVVLDDFDIRVQIVYNIELNKKLIVFSFQRTLLNESEMPLIVQIHGGTNGHKQFGVPFAVRSLADGYAWFKTSRRGSLDDNQHSGGATNEVVLMHREAVSISRFARFSIKPYGSSDFGYSSPLPVSLPTNGQYGLCCQPTTNTHAFPLYVRIDQSDTDSSGGVHLQPCGLIVNNLPCPVEVEVVSSEGILYVESEQIMRNSRRVLYNIDLSYCRVRLKTALDAIYSDWSENIYFESNSDGAPLSLSIRNGITGSVATVSLTYSTNSSIKSISFFHPFWLSNCTDVNVIPLINSGDRPVESVQLGQEGLWYIQPHFDRKLNSLAVTLMRPHSTGSIVSIEATPIDGSFATMSESFCLCDPMVIHADTIRNNDDSIETEPTLMDYTLFSVLPRFVVENALPDKVIILRQFGGGTEYTLSSRDKISFSFSSLEQSSDVQFRILGESRWSRFAISLNVDADHPLFVLSEGTSETSEPVYPIPVSVKVETVRGISYVRLCQDETPVYVVENRCPYVHSVIALAPKLRLSTTDDKSVEEIVFSPSPDDERKIPIFFENTDRKVIRLIICFDESTKFKEVELDVSQFTNVLSEAIKARESIMNARQPILVPCQGYPVVLVSVIRSPSNPSQIVIAVSPKDTSMSNWLGDHSNMHQLGGGGHNLVNRGKALISVSLPRLKLNICDSFTFYLDEIGLKISKKKIDEFSINELFVKSILAEQTRSEEQVVFATVDKDKGLIATADRITHPSTASGSSVSLSDVRVELSQMELTVSNSVLDDIEYIISSFKEALVDKKQMVMNSAAYIARSGTPYSLTVDINSVLGTTRTVRLVEFHDLRVSEILIHAWSELVYNRSKFISPEIRLILSILSLSDTLRLDGAEIKLPSEHIFRKLWRGPSSQLLSTIGDIYKKSLAENAASFSIVASSNVLNVVGGGLFRSSRDRRVIKKNND